MSLEDSGLTNSGLAFLRDEGEAVENETEGRGQILFKHSEKLFTPPPSLQRDFLPSTTVNEFTGQ